MSKRGRMARMACIASWDREHPIEYGRAYEAHEGEEMHDYALSADKAKAWVSRMVNEDGTKGQHWTMEQTSQVMAQKGYQCDPTEFWVTMNMLYSDYCKALGPAGTPDVYAAMAHAFLDDKDAHEDKLARYYHAVAKH